MTIYTRALVALLLTGIIALIVFLLHRAVVAYQYGDMVGCYFGAMGAAFLAIFTVFSLAEKR